ncbi:hypothetical protein FIE12Z_9443 [Fusarium flagelliforme]|uniref:Uncharacterized protein n=1 Tax=Fusarium flagelliforme TaxID=2675880 RepID=A0A395MGP2_9HYPO|nr:hypothetical protein FIE12Z_9443 [Fusarium flagelliforme]
MHQASQDSLRAIVQFMVPPRPPPLTLDDATRALYEKAIADPSSLSDERRREILQRLPREEEDALCYDICGSTMSELVTKAIQDPDSLVYMEVNLLVAGLPRDRNRKMLQQSARLSKEDRDLHHKALEAAMTEDEAAARTVTRAKQLAKGKARDAADKALDVYDADIIRSGALKQIRGCVPWQEHIMSLSGSTKTRAPCGFVMFYPKDKDPECSAFKGRLEEFVSHGFHRHIGAAKEPVMNGFKLYDMQYDSLESLPRRFAAMRDSGDIPTGLRRDAVLYVDDEAFRSLDSARPFVLLWELQEKQGTEEQLGPLKVDIKHVAPLLLMRLTQRDMSLEKRQLKLWSRGPEFENLHKDASKSKENGDYDGIWPPRHLAM